MELNASTTINIQQRQQQVATSTSDTEYCITLGDDVMCACEQYILGFSWGLRRKQNWRGNTSRYRLGTTAAQHFPLHFFSAFVFYVSPPSGLILRGAVASWSVRSNLDRAVRVRALTGDIVLCSKARHITLTVSLST